MKAWLTTVKKLLAWIPAHPVEAAAVTGLLLLVVAGIWLLRRRPWRGARTRYPIVLVHGLMGFDTIGVGPLRQDYFRGVADHLRGCGVKVLLPRMAPTAAIAQRAGELAAAIKATNAPRVNLIGHSMGGLDARYLVAKLGLAHRVASVTTIGTPHRGTPVADIGFGLGKLLGKVGLAALGDLTSEAAAAFNRDVVDRRGVFYGCVLASVRKGGADVHPLLKPSLALLRQHGPSDGLVPVRSQRWGKVLLRVRADHWAQIGWSRGIDTPALYERIVRKLRARGL